LHHHVPKNEVNDYLKNIYSNLLSGGFYILSDEFIPNYNNSQEREIKAVIWYSYVIGKALNREYDYLAQEEAKTLLDDINEGRNQKYYKDYSLVSDVLDMSKNILKLVQNDDISKAEEVAENFLRTLPTNNNDIDHTDNNHLSREDFKICHSELLKEIDNSGFNIINVTNIGNVDKIGGMSIYLLQK
jgi:hypothetical protein